MSETVVKKQRRRAGQKTPKQIAEECDLAQAKMRADYYRRQAEREARAKDGNSR